MNLSEDFRGQRHDLVILQRLQLLRHNRRNSRSQRIAVLVDQHTRIIVKTDHRPIGSSEGRLCSHHYSTADVSSLDSVVGALAGDFCVHGSRLFDDHGDFITHFGKVARPVAENLDTFGHLSSRIIDDVEESLQINHGWLQEKTFFSVNASEHTRTPHSLRLVDLAHRNYKRTQSRRE